METENTLTSIKDLFGLTRYFKPHPTTSRPVSERGALIGYFAKEMEREPSIIGIRLAHYSLSQLYALQTIFCDRLKRDGKTAAHKYFWYISKTGNPTKV